MVPRAPGLLRLGGRAGAAEQLASRRSAGPAWSRDRASGRLYLHSFYAEQPDLDWRNPDGSRGDGGRRPLLGRTRSRRLPRRRRRPVGQGRRAPRRSAGDGAVPAADDRTSRRSRSDPLPRLARDRNRPGRAARGGRRGAADRRGLPAGRPRPAAISTTSTASSPSTCCTPLGTPSELAAAIERSNAAGGVAWVTSNHDFPRVATRWGEENARPRRSCCLRSAAPPSSTRARRSG